jgi:hypothetical protein
VVAGDALRSLEELLAEDGGYRNLDPFLGRPALVPCALAAAPRGHGLVSVVEGLSLVGRVPQHLADLPGLTAGWAGDSLLVEEPADASDGVATGHEVVEDTANDNRLRFIDLQVAGARRPSR